MEPQTLAPAVMGERVNEAGGDRLVKSNILYIDGRNLHQSRILHYCPIGRNEEKADEGLVDDSNVSLLSRYVREILVLLCYSDSRHYARKFGVPVEDYRKRFANYLESGCPAALHQTPYPIEQTIWYVVKRQYRFQADSLYNQLEDVCVSILNLSLVEVPAGSPSLGLDVLLGSLDEYHSRLFANYYKWCDYLGAAPFPWKCPPWLEDSYCADDRSKGCNLTSECANLQDDGPDKLWSTRTRQEMQKMMFEVAVFKLLWSEAANLRHTPELLCWLFHWFCMAWDKDFKPEENFTDLIRDVVQRIRDEQWYLASALRTPDHNARLLYDDFNELFWDRRCLEILNRPAVEGEFQGKDIQKGDPPVRRLARTASSSELQLDNSLNPKDPGKNGSPAGYLVSRESLNAVIMELSYASKPGSGIKTFTEERTYAQVGLHDIRLLKSNLLQKKTVEFLNLSFLGGKTTWALSR